MPIVPATEGGMHCTNNKNNSSDHIQQNIIINKQRIAKNR
jgi:hypothetical protein